jgi:hypothetical protein
VTHRHARNTLYAGWRTGPWTERVVAWWDRRDRCATPLVQRAAPGLAPEQSYEGTMNPSDAPTNEEKNWINSQSRKAATAYTGFGWDGPGQGPGQNVLLRGADLERPA